MISRRRLLAGASAAGLVGAAARLPAAALAGAVPRAAARPAGRDLVLRIVQDPPGGRAMSPPVAPGATGGDAPHLWRLGAREFVDPRALEARLARCAARRIHATVDSANHLLLLDALRARGGTILRQRWSAGTACWTLEARVRALRLPGNGAVHV